MSTATEREPAVRAAPSPAPEARQPGGRRRQVLTRLELLTGGSALLGGSLLMTAPDGALLSLDLTVLDGSPFVNWRLPGFLLATLIGGGYLTAGIWLRPTASALANCLCLPASASSPSRPSSSRGSVSTRCRPSSP